MHNFISEQALRDADDNPRTALDSVKTALENNDYAIPASFQDIENGTPKTSIFIAPNNLGPGSLETIFYSNDARKRMYRTDFSMR